MFNSESFSRDVHDRLGHLIDRHHLFRPDVHRSSKIGIHQTPHSLNTFVNVEKRTGLFAVSPYFDLASAARGSDFPAQCRWCFFAASIPCSFRAKYIVESRYTYVQAMIARKGGIDPLTKQLFPPILAVGSCRIGS